MKIFSKEIKQLIARRVLAEIERLKPQKHADGSEFGTELMQEVIDKTLALKNEISNVINDHFESLNANNRVSEDWEKSSKDAQKHVDELIKCLHGLDKIYNDAFINTTVEEAVRAGQVEEAINIDSTDDMTDAFIGSEELEAMYKEGFFDADELSGELEHEIRDRRYFALAVQNTESQNKGLVFFNRSAQQEVEEYMHQFVELNKQLKQAKPGYQEQLLTEIEGLYDALPLEDEIALNRDEVDELSRRGYDFLKSNFSI